MLAGTEVQRQPGGCDAHWGSAAVRKNTRAGHRQEGQQTACPWGGAAGQQHSGRTTRQPGTASTLAGTCLSRKDSALPLEARLGRMSTSSPPLQKARFEVQVARRFDVQVTIHQGGLKWNDGRSRPCWPPLLATVAGHRRLQHQPSFGTEQPLQDHQDTCL